jgi:hypothetical protein
MVLPLPLRTVKFDVVNEALRLLRFSVADEYALDEPFQITTEAL